MKWMKGSTPHYIYTECGYYISKCGPADDFVYTAWAPRVERGIPNPIGNFDTLQEAKDACITHKQHRGNNS